MTFIMRSRLLSVMTGAAILLLSGINPVHAEFDDDLVWKIGSQNGSSAEFGATAPLTYTVPADWKTRTVWSDFRKSINNETNSISWTQTVKERANLYVLTQYLANPNPANFRVKLNGHELWNGGLWYSSVRLYLPEEFQIIGTNVLEISGKVELDVLHLNREGYNRKPITGWYQFQEHPNGFESLYDIMRKTQKNIDYGPLLDHIDGTLVYCMWEDFEPVRGNRSVNNVLNRPATYHSRILANIKDLFEGSNRKIQLHNGLGPVWNFGYCWPIQHDATYPEDITSFFNWLLQTNGVARYITHVQTIGECGLTWGGTTAGVIDFFTRYAKAVKAADPNIWVNGFSRCDAMYWAMTNNPAVLATTDGTGFHYGQEQNDESGLRYDLDRRGGARFKIIADEGQEGYCPQLVSWVEYLMVDLNTVGPGYYIGNTGWCPDGMINPETNKVNTTNGWYPKYVSERMWSEIYHFSHRTFAHAEYGTAGATQNMWIGSCVKDGGATATIQNTTTAAQTVTAIVPVPKTAATWTVRLFKFNGEGIPLLQLSSQTIQSANDEVKLTGISIPASEHRTIRIYPDGKAPDPLALKQVAMTSSATFLNYNQTAQLTLTGYAENGTTVSLTGATITYSSTDSSIISVSGTGLVKHLSLGGARQVVRASVSLGGKTVASNGLTVFTAKKVVPVASTCNNGTAANLPANAYDGKLDTYWKYSLATDYIQYDLGSKKAVSRIRYNYNLLDEPEKIKMGTYGNVMNYRWQYRPATVKVSDDPTFATFTVGVDMKPTDPYEKKNSTDASFSPVVGRYVRVVPKLDPVAAMNANSRFGELEVYGDSTLDGPIVSSGDFRPPAISDNRIAVTFRSPLRDLGDIRINGNVTSISLYDFSGRLIEKFGVKNSRVVMTKGNLNLKSGMYSIRINDSKVFKKVVVVR